jgi:hypothetical protein
MRALPQDQDELELGPRDEIDDAAALVDATIAAAAADELLPTHLPATVIPLFTEFGRSLRTDEVVHGAFGLLVSDRQGTVPGRFTAAQEIEILDALRSHKTSRLRIRGTGKFTVAHRSLHKILRVDEVSVVLGTGPTFVEGTRAIWETVQEMGASVPHKLWEQVPTDLATRSRPLSESAP